MALSDATIALLRIDSPAFLAPKFAAAVTRVQERMRGEGHKPRLFETLRLPALQAQYFANGTSGQQDVLRSFHGTGMAADIICADREWNATPQFWDAYRRACVAESLQWGGLWSKPVDKPHCQLGVFTGRVPDAIVAAMNSGGLAAVWALAKAL